MVVKNRLQTFYIYQMIKEGIIIKGAGSKRKVMSLSLDV